MHLRVLEDDHDVLKESCHRHVAFKLRLGRQGRPSTPFRGVVKIDLHTKTVVFPRFEKMKSTPERE
jgi:hypothetical protein